MLEGKAVIGETDMLEALQQDALDLAAKALDIFDVTEATEIARFIKKEFDRTYGAGWQCIVGTDFGSFVTHCFGCFIYFRISSLAILLFRGSAACQEPDEPAADQFANFETVKA
ncbi:dynein light chain 2, cytoplasmic [Mangifera indica]|uniref:dynein light chain 2, cytoplasmic n=1 Tax=Mangifera indica TaxID=29780 RepID=UPI001CFB9416|nr:dynein light chain 2, cytoplasmic [Mangifera indica]